MKISIRTIIRSTAVALISLGAFALLSTGCAKTIQTSSKDFTKKYFDAWLQTNLPNAEHHGLGIYILPELEKEGTGEAITDSSFVMAHFTKRAIDGTIVETSEEELAKQLGLWKEANWYGPKKIFVYKGSTITGIYETLIDMKVGGERTAVIPSWHTSYKWRDTEQEYIDNNENDADMIISVKIDDVTKDLEQWTLDSLQSYCKRNLGLELKDTTSKGFYYKPLSLPATDTTKAKIKADSSVFINYTGRLLNGQVFDTTIEDTAKTYHIYDPSRSYKPAKISWAEKSEDIQMVTESGASGLITGFQKLLWEMNTPQPKGKGCVQKGVGVFWYNLAYKDKATGGIIPPFSSLRFDIEFTEDPSKEAK